MMLSRGSGPRAAAGLRDRVARLAGFLVAFLTAATRQILAYAARESRPVTPSWRAEAGSAAASCSSQVNGPVNRGSEATCVVTPTRRTKVQYSASVAFHAGFSKAGASAALSRPDTLSSAM